MRSLKIPLQIDLRYSSIANFPGQFKRRGNLNFAALFKKGIIDLTDEPARNFKLDYPARRAPGTKILLDLDV